MNAKVNIPLEKVLKVYEVVGSYRLTAERLGVSESWVFFRLRNIPDIARKTFWTDKRIEALTLISKGASDAELMARFSTSRSSVVSFRHREGITRTERKGSAQRALRVGVRHLFTSDTPPSLAMIRLAEFDPVIARALALRTGKKAPSEGMADSSEGEVA